jgi:hypothetical protein
MTASPKLPADDPDLDWAKRTHAQPAPPDPYLQPVEYVNSVVQQNLQTSLAPIMQPLIDKAFNAGLEMALSSLGDKAFDAGLEEAALYHDGEAERIRKICQPLTLKQIDAIGDHDEAATAIRALKRGQR